jgi:hypothetical protein
MCDGFEPVKAPAKKIAHANSQAEINQSKHTRILCNLAGNTGANPKRAISSVKPQKYSRREILRFPVLQSRRHVIPLMNSLQTANAAMAEFGQSKGIATWP